MSETNPTKITIVDYEMGNLRSVAKMLSRLGADIRVSSDASDLDWADRLVLPGVGAFPDAIEKLGKLKLRDALDKQVLNAGKPVLGICLGMELFARSSSEVGMTEGLGWIDAEIVPFERSSELRVPHVGWNEIEICEHTGLFEDVSNGASFYFVHSYHAQCKDSSIIAATVEYGGQVTAAIVHKNIWATQFHPEKSQRNGQILLANFISGDIG